MPFAVPITWREPKNHVEDSYFCCVCDSDLLANNRRKLVYPNMNFAMRQIPLDKNLPGPQPPQNGLAVL